MSKLRFAIVTAALAGAVSASATIVNFDDLATPNTDGPKWGTVPSSYQGMTWTGWEVVKADGGTLSYQTVYGNSYGAPSSPNFAYNGGTGYKSISVESGSFDFGGARVTSFAQNNAYQSWSSRNLTIIAYNKEGSVGSTSVSLSASSFQPLPDAAMFQDITKLEFVGDGAGKYWGLDNFEFTLSPEPTAPPVPEPTTMIAGAFLLLPFGLSIIRSLRKSRPA
jgi:hypothetical protein